MPFLLMIFIAGIRNHLLEHDFKCPNCFKSMSPDNLVINKGVRSVSLSNGPHTLMYGHFECCNQVVVIAMVLLYIVFTEVSE